MSFYNDEFYVDLHDQTLYPASIILDIILGVLPKISSAVDVGCAVGSWLSVLKDRGVEQIKGIDGDWVNRDYLQIPQECFSSVDLNQPFTLRASYDLAMSLEVAEHLPRESAKYFVESLTLLSDFVVFSAAIPHQGGTNHVNEQWLEYWCALFEQQGYQGVDVVRRTIWDDRKIPFWYKQNLVLFVRRTRLDELNLDITQNDFSAISLVHPEQYLSAKVAARIVRHNLKSRLPNFLQRLVS